MNAKQAAEKALNLGKQLQAVIDVGEVLDRIGNLELAESSAHRDAMEAFSKREEVETELKEAEGNLELVRTECSYAKAEAKKVMDEATQSHDHMLAVAREERDKMIKQTTESSNAFVEKAKSEIHSLQNKRDGLLKEVTDAQKSVTNLENQMKALKDSLG